ncbi:NmrA family NAD(P)-binding protein [Mycobacterium sp.]|uniref:NmrA family NAD(P)-binding protein n=1 Tax=Mycobacterium sp. TaxID=1785 RepID=UPI003D0B98D4
MTDVDQYLDRTEGSRPSSITATAGDQPLILVTGASGKTGRTVVRTLREHGARVRALVHRHDARSDLLTQWGAEVVAADIFDPLAVRAAMRGVSRLYYVPHFHPHMTDSAVNVATAAHAEGVEAIVGLSQWLASPLHPSLATRQTWLVQRLFDMVPAASHTVVQPGYFADNYLAGLIGFAAQLGVLPVLAGDQRNAPPSNEDIGRVAAAILLDPQPHAGRRYRPTGPALLSNTDIAAMVGHALGRRVRPAPMPVWMMLKALRATGGRVGLDTFQISQIRHYWTEGQRGTWEVHAPTTDVYDLTGRSPEDFATIAARYATLPQARRTAGNLTRALWDFTRIGLTPRPALDRFVRTQQHPQPLTPELAADSVIWKREHREEQPERERSVIDAIAKVAR